MSASAASNVVSIPKKIKATHLRCIRCNVSIEAACDCGVGYERWAPKERAAKALKSNPEKSNRVIAQEIGVNERTVRNTRGAGAEKSAPERRTGADGKNYPASQPPKLKTVDDDTATRDLYNRACEASSLAEWIDGTKVDKNLVKAVRDAADAWDKLLKIVTAAERANVEK